ncbi:MAG: hypothetical protein RSA79_06915, partial [Oscillospiraceae bacterium]
LDVFVERAKSLDINIEFTNEAINKIAKIGYDQVYGARPLRRAITSNIEDLLSQKILNGSIPKNSNVILNVSENEFVFNVK